ncbi:transcriptional regulator with XRE-family HTH domain [Pararhizobium capsulatum DSM 1112]|uniref:Transcriptional regulator with XRE-family HTH domain n=1 Tax=Pararhizobium capsulatum DSM 1112 TaxID=1121113 RepID=A0ABU0BRU5_9HYPH|nr:helix-turn-helix transcriptional regulator [Pararhizobium capsulatum]MDQ0320982.1 transcriptional regulator with XRE-family HTH domain [Pararhizobium capsulatum DSM 1112]
MIDSAWFYQQLEKDGRSLRGMARTLGLDPSAVSRMLRGERKMTADEQDGIAEYLDVPMVEVAARRRGKALGLAERGQEPLIRDDKVSAQGKRGNGDTHGADNFLDRIRGRMAGTITVAPGVDLTEPADPDWARVYDDDYPISL